MIKNSATTKKKALLPAIIKNLRSKRFINQESANLLSALTAADPNNLKVNKSQFSPELRNFALSPFHQSTSP